jgi:hypothetical protein
MSAPATNPLDTIRTFLGPIPDAEHERRAKLESYRNAAMALIARTECDTARLLAWQVIEWATPWLYAPGVPPEWLDELNTLSKRLMLTALQSEAMADKLRGAAHDD